MTLMLYTIVGPMLLAVWVGWRGGKDGPTTRGEFARSCGFALLWGVALVYLWQALWMFSLGTAGLGAVAFDAGLWTILSAVFWGPVLVIAYVIRARRRLRE